MKRDRAIRYALDNGIFSPGELTLPEIAAQLNECHRQFLSSARSTFEAAWRGGGLVLMAKGRLPHGGLLPWLETETELSERRARAWMRIHVKVPITAVTADLKIESCLKQIAFQPS